MNHAKQLVSQQDTTVKETSTLFDKLQKIVQESIKQKKTESDILSDISNLKLVMDFEASNILSRMKENDEMLREIQLKCWESMNQFQTVFYEKMKTVFKLRNEIRQHITNLLTYKKVFSDSIASAVKAIKLADALPKAYENVCNEILRRNEFKKLLEQTISEVNQKFKSLSVEENEKRVKFSEAINELPDGFIAGLEEHIPIIRIQCPKIDQKLPSMDQDSVDDISEWQIVGDANDVPNEFDLSQTMMQKVSDSVLFTKTDDLHKVSPRLIFTANPAVENFERKERK